MAKTKNKKRLSENMNKKNESKKEKKTLNPFEVHINKEKIRVLGRKLKNDRGLPGVARAKALKKRKQVLLPEYNVQHKSNNFLDKRIGERNKELTIEDKSMVRYTAVRVKQHNKKSMFNLADDEILTHRGQTLSEIEKFENPISDDDDDSLDGQFKTGDLERSFVQDAHFGGGILKKHDGTKSHKDLIDQLIAESKKRKAEKQKLKEVTLELTEKLDIEWKDLLPIVSKTKNEKLPIIKPTQVDEYDKVMRELKFEARGIPSNKLKTEDEIAKEEKEKLENLETERLARMRGTITNTNSTNTKNHRSADDLDDNFAYNSDTSEITLSYNNEGTSNIKLDIINKTQVDDNSDEEVDEEELETDNDSLSDLKESEEGDEESTGYCSSETNINIENLHDEENTDKLIKLESTKRKLCDINQEENTKKVKIFEPENQKCKDQDLLKIKIDLFQRKDIMEKAIKELPYIYCLPENYETLHNTLENHSSLHQGLIIERMIKCNHPSLNEGNKNTLGLLFIYLIQYINDICNDAKDENTIQECFKIFSSLVPHLFDLAQLNQENAHMALLEVIKEKQSNFRNSNKFPKIDVLLYLKLVSCLFSTSDFRNQVVTPCIIFMEQMLLRCKVKTRKDVAYGLFIVCLIAEFTSLSKRYSPGAIKFLSGILHMAIPKNGVRLIKVLLPFKNETSSLALNSSATNIKDYKLDCTDLLHTHDFDDIFRIRALYASTGLLINFCKNFSTLSSCLEIFKISSYYVNNIPLVNYPDIIVDQIQEFKKLLIDYELNRKIEFILIAKKRPKALRLYEPNIVRVYDGKTHKVQSRTKAERDKLLHKIKKEQKGALREIRRDKTFLGRIKINHKLQSDFTRKQKVKQIFSDAAIQQSEINSMDRKNISKNK